MREIPNSEFEIQFIIWIDDSSVIRMKQTDIEREINVNCVCNWWSSLITFVHFIYIFVSHFSLSFYSGDNYNKIISSICEQTAVSEMELINLNINLASSSSNRYFLLMFSRYFLNCWMFFCSLNKKSYVDMKWFFYMQIN